MRSEQEEDGAKLSEEETLEAVPVLLRLDASLGGNAGVGRAIRLAKAEVST